MKITLLFWVAVFGPVAIALAIFEIWLDVKHKVGPWGKTVFKNPYWEKKALQKWAIPFLKYISRYHVVMFLVVMPVLFAAGIVFWSKVLKYNVLPNGSSWLMNLLSFATLFVAIWLGNSGFEDMFYFIIQSLTGWYQPHALRRVVIDKDFAWFKDWLPPIFGLNIPGHWVFCPSVAVLLLCIRQYWIMR